MKLKELSYEGMWEIVKKLAAGATIAPLAKKYGITTDHVRAIAQEYDVGRQCGQTSRDVQKETAWVEKQLSWGLRPEVKQTQRFGGQKFTLRVRKDLLGPAEKAQIIAGMKKTPGLSAIAYAQEFKRLPATIVKIAAEAGITLR